MEKFKNVRNKMLRQMAFSIFTMAILPAASQTDSTAEAGSWNRGTDLDCPMNLSKGYQVSDRDDVPGIPGKE